MPIEAPVLRTADDLTAAWLVGYLQPADGGLTELDNVAASEEVGSDARSAIAMAAAGSPGSSGTAIGRSPE